MGYMWIRDGLLWPTCSWARGRGFNTLESFEECKRLYFQSETLCLNSYSWRGPTSTDSYKRHGTIISRSHHLGHPDGTAFGAPWILCDLPKKDEAGRKGVLRSGTRERGVASQTGPWFSV